MYLGSDASRSRLYRQSATSKTAIRPCSKRRRCATSAAPLSSGRCANPRLPPCWSTRATTAISWRKRFSSSQVVGHTLAHYLDGVRMRQAPGCAAVRFSRTRADFDAAPLCSGLVAKYWFERFARLPSSSMLRRVSLPRCAAAPGQSCDLRVTIGRDSRLARALRQGHKQHVISVVNVPTSTIARSDVVMPRSPAPRSRSPRPRRSPVNSRCWRASRRCRSRPRYAVQDDENKLVHALIRCRADGGGARLEPAIEQLARDLAKCSDVLYLGAGYPCARRRAQAQEISYIHAESTRGLKHGPIALIDEKMPVISRAARPRVRKTLSTSGSRRARRRDHSLDRPQGRARAQVDSTKLVLPVCLQP